MDHFLVTGGAGFIGSNIVERLLTLGHKVRILDNFSTGKEENINHLLKIYPDKLELIKGDIRDIEICNRAMADIDFVLHEAALGSVPRSINDPITTNSVNVDGTLNILWAAHKAKVKRVVAASSSSVYGHGEYKDDKLVVPKREDHIPSPLSPYAISKLSGEHYGLIFNDIYGMETVLLRYFNVFGPKQDPISPYAAVIPKFIRAILNEESPTIFGDGHQSRDFTYVENVVKANISACYAQNAPGRIINIASGKRYSILDLVKELSIIMGKKVIPIFTEPRRGDVRHSLADINIAKEVLNYKVEIGFREGLSKTVEYFKSYKW